jgi:hypothetical protein
MLVVDPVLVEPVVKGDFEVDMVTKVSRSGRGNKELCFIGNGVVTIEFLVGPFIVL